MQQPSVVDPDPVGPDQIRKILKVRIRIVLIVTHRLRIKIWNKSSRIRNIVTTVLTTVLRPPYLVPYIVSLKNCVEVPEDRQLFNFTGLPKSLLFDKLELSLRVVLSLQLLEIRIRIEPHNLTHPDQFKFFEIWFRILFLICSG